MEGVQTFSGREGVLPALPGADSHDHIGKALFPEFLNRGDLPPADKLCAESKADRDVLFYLWRNDAEVRNGMGDDTAGFFTAFKYRHRNAGSGQEGSRGEARGACADHSDLLSGAACTAGAAGGTGLRRAQGREYLCAGCSGCREFGLADVQGLLVVIAHALVPAVVGADRSRNEGKGISLQNDAEGLLRILLSHGPQVGGNILADGTSLPAGGCEAVKERELFFDMAVRERFDRFCIETGGCRVFVHCLDGCDVHTSKGGAAAVHETVRDLAHPLVSARLEHVGGHGDGPDPRVKEGLYVIDGRSA